MVFFTYSCSITGTPRMECSHQRTLDDLLGALLRVRELCSDPAAAPLRPASGHLPTNQRLASEYVGKRELTSRISQSKNFTIVPKVLLTKANHCFYSALTYILTLLFDKHFCFRATLFLFFRNVFPSYVQYWWFFTLLFDQKLKLCQRQFLNVSALIQYWNFFF